MNDSKYKYLDNTIIIMYTGGKSMANIAKELGLYSSMVGYRVKILGISRSISESLVGQAKSKSHRKTLSENRINSGVARGSKNPNWQGGVSTEHDKIRHNIEQRLWKRAVKERDGACMSCGDRKNLHAHHILPFSTYPHLRTAINNGMTLCKKCHVALHKGVKFHSDELLETLTVNDEGNQQPSVQSTKVQRLLETSDSLNDQPECPTRKG